MSRDRSSRAASPTSQGAPPPVSRRDISAWAAGAAATSLVLLVAAAVLLNLNLHRLAEARRLVIDTAELLTSQSEVLGDLVDAETGQRGFLLTGEERYLEPYRAATSRVWADFAELQGQISVPELRDRLERVRPLIRAKLAELEQTVELRRRSVEDALAVVRTDEGQRLMEAIRAEFAAIESAERQLYTERSAVLEQRARSAALLAAGCAMLSLLSAGLGTAAFLRRRDQRRVIEQNIRLERQVQERTAALEEANSELEAFGATISHDLRAPLRAVAGYAAALEEDVGAQLDTEARGYLSRISGAAERMDALIDDILAYSRLARQHLRLGRVSLEGVVDAALEAHHEAAAASGAQVKVVRPLHDVLGHPQALEAAVSNLIGNALKFVEPGKPPNVTVWTERRGGEVVRLWVKDEGIGIAPSKQEEIFRPFERLHGREAYPGTGVGLAVVRRVAERLGGSCGVTSGLGAGSAFWVDIPAWSERQ